MSDASKKTLYALGSTSFKKKIICISFCDSHYLLVAFIPKLANWNIFYTYVNLNGRWLIQQK